MRTREVRTQDVSRSKISTGNKNYNDQLQRSYKKETNSEITNIQLTQFRVYTADHIEHTREAGTYSHVNCFPWRTGLTELKATQ